MGSLTLCCNRETTSAKIQTIHFLKGNRPVKTTKWAKNRRASTGLPSTKSCLTNGQTNKRRREKKSSTHSTSIPTDMCHLLRLTKACGTFWEATICSTARTPSTPRSTTPRKCRPETTNTAQNFSNSASSDSSSKLSDNTLNTSRLSVGSTLAMTAECPRRSFALMPPRRP